MKTIIRNDAGGMYNMLDGNIVDEHSECRSIPNTGCLPARSLKIGLFADTYYPQINGVATSVLMLKEYLSKQGHQVFVFTTTDPGAPAKEEGVYRLPSLPFVSARRVALFFHPPMARLVRSLNLDIIHTHTEFSLGIFGRYMAKELNIPLLHTMHTIYEEYTHYIFKFRFLDPLSKTAARLLSSDFCNAADQVIVPTDKVRDLMLAYGVAKPLQVIPTGIALERFQQPLSGDERNMLRQNLGIAPEDKVLLYIGRLAEEKNIDELLGGLQVYFRQRPGKFLIVGDGPDRQRLEALSGRLGQSRRVIFAGARPWDEIHRYYSLGDVFFSASQSETQGLTYLEALAAGLPLVVKRDRCLEGVLQEGRNGYSFRDQVGMLQGLDEILAGDRVVVAAMSRAAAGTALGFSAQGYAAAVARLYFALSQNQVQVPDVTGPLGHVS